jgi:hypothetical protein
MEVRDWTVGDHTKHWGLRQARELLKRTDTSYGGWAVGLLARHRQVQGHLSPRDEKCLQAPESAPHISRGTVRYWLIGDLVTRGDCMPREDCRTLQLQWRGGQGRGCNAGCTPHMHTL